MEIEGDVPTSNRQKEESSDWAKPFLSKSLNPRAPQAARDALNHLFIARKKARARKHELAYDNYKQAMLLFLMQTRRNPGNGPRP